MYMLNVGNYAGFFFFVESPLSTRALHKRRGHMTCSFTHYSERDFEIREWCTPMACLPSYASCTCKLKIAVYAKKKVKQGLWYACTYQAMTKLPNLYHENTYNLPTHNVGIKDTVVRIPNRTKTNIRADASIIQEMSLAHNDKIFGGIKKKIKNDGTNVGARSQSSATFNAKRRAYGSSS